MTSRILDLLLILTTPRRAKIIGNMVRANLNGDGRVECFALVHTGDGICDVNRLTGKGTLSGNGGPHRPITANQPALPVTD